MGDASLPSARLPSAHLPSARLPGARLPGAHLPAGTHRRVEAIADWVVVRGRATIELDDGAAVLEVRPGVLGRLPAGTVATWHVREPIDLLEVSEATIVYRAEGGLPATRPFHPRRRVG